MEWHGEQMLPRGLPELVYQLTPAWILRGLKVIAFDGKESDKVLASVGRCDSHWRVKIYPQMLLTWPPVMDIRGRPSPGVMSFMYWKNCLMLILHELGHIVNGDLDVRQIVYRKYEEDKEFRHFVESSADSWADRMLEIVATRDSRLGQPSGFTGELPSPFMLNSFERMKRRSPNEFRKYSIRRIEDLRAYRCGGQLTTNHIAKIIHTPSLKFSSETVKRMVKRTASKLGITRQYVDRAGKKHIFFNHAEAMEIVSWIKKGFLHTDYFEGRRSYYKKS